MESEIDAARLDYMDGFGEGKGDGKKVRFSEEQIRSLEAMFAAQTKLEPRQKLQLASELGLQPRQVAIWFQNKRARWKSKRLEREYAALRDDYDALLRSYEALKKDKHGLLKQVETLAERLRGEDSNAGGAGDLTVKEGLDGASGDDLRSSEGGGGFARLPNEEVYLQTASFASAATLDHQFDFDPSWPASDQPCSSSRWWGFGSLSE